MTVRFEKGDNYNIPDLAIVKAKKYNSGKVEITYTSNQNTNLKKYKKINANEYVNTETGEINQYETTNGFKSDKSLKRTLNNSVRPLLENNFCGGNNEKFITLTFDTTNPKFEELSKIFTNFWKRLCRYCSQKGLTLACVYVKELQVTRGVWHIHALIKEIHNKNLFIEWKILQRIWKLGYVWINSVISMVDYTSYQINIEKEMNTLPIANIHSVNKVIDYMCKPKSKQGIIPRTGRIYGVKGNLKKPMEFKGFYKSIYKRHLEQRTLSTDNTLLVIDENTDNILNTIHNQTWIKPNNNNQKI